MSADTKEHPFYSLIASANQASPSNGMVGRALHAIRSHLGMEVAYVSEFVGDRTVFRQVDAPGLENIIKVGDSYSLDDVYCRHILEGRLPQLIPDTADHPVAVAMPMTQALPIGKHMSVPIRLPDGSVYGMFCCVGFKADRSLHERDLQMMKVFADLAAFEINRELETATVVKEKQQRIKTVIEKQQFSTVYQPIWRLDNVRPIGFESLSRFAAAPTRSPEKWFAEAAEAGLGTPLELAAARLGLSALESLPSDIYVAVNVSPQTILSGDLRHALGAGYSSLQHILQIRPDLIKLDITLTHNINLDPARKALASALVVFARETGSRLIAEGVETASELSALRDIGIAEVQGYFLGRPTPFADAVKLLDRRMTLANLVA
jgi:EAL domain-containing protein (putative c-di-GMP-specific phosphodiesterase class I)